MDCTEYYFISKTISRDIFRPPGLRWIPRWCRERKQKWGKCAGLLTNRCSLQKLSLSCAHQQNGWAQTEHCYTEEYKGLLYSDSCRGVAKLQYKILDTVELADHLLLQADRTADSGGNPVEDFVFKHTSYRTNTTIINKFCSPDLEYQILKCRLFHLPKEYTVFVAMAVYIAPHANAKLSLGHKYYASSKQLKTHPDVVFIIAGYSSR